MHIYVQYNQKEKRERLKCVFLAILLLKMSIRMSVRHSIGEDRRLNYPVLKTFQVHLSVSHTT